MHCIDYICYKCNGVFYSRVGLQEHKCYSKNHEVMKEELAKFQEKFSLVGSERQGHLATEHKHMEGDSLL